MPKLPDFSKLGATPGKLALIAVLAVVLVIVLAVQFGGDLGAGQPREDAPDGKSGGPEPPVPRAGPAPSPSGRGGERHDARQPWPKLELAEVSAYDPFAAATPVAGPMETPSETAANETERVQREQILEQLRENGVRAVIGSSRHGNAAVIGAETVRVGDVLAGFRVVDVEADGVVLEPSPSE